MENDPMSKFEELMKSLRKHFDELDKELNAMTEEKFHKIFGQDF